MSLANAFISIQTAQKFENWRHRSAGGKKTTKRCKNYHFFSQIAPNTKCETTDGTNCYPLPLPLSLDSLTMFVLRWSAGEPGFVL
jgi:hypothetical protein